MAIFTGNSTNFKRSDDAVKLGKLKDAVVNLIAELDNAEASGVWEHGAWVIPESTSNRIDHYKETLRSTMEEIK